MKTRRKVIISLIACLLFIPSVASAKETELKSPAVKTAKAQKICPSAKVEREKQKVEGDRTVQGAVILEPLQMLMDYYKLNKTEEQIEVLCLDMI